MWAPRWLEEHPKVAWVAFLGLPSHVDHERAKQLLRKDTWGGVLSFGVIGGPDAGAKVVDMMKLATNMANVGMFACFTDAGRRVVHVSCYRRCEDDHYKPSDYNSPATH